MVAAIAGLASPFFQKVFVDRLLASESSFAGLSASLGINFSAQFDSIQPPILVFFAFVSTLLAQAFGLIANFAGAREGVILQREFSERIYRKTLSLRTDAMGSTTVGEVVAMYATDIPGSTAIVDQAIPMGAGILFPLIFAPLAVYWLSGIPVGATLIVMALIVGLNLVLATRQSRFFFLFKQLAAERTGIVNEWVQNIRLLRVLGWVENFEQKIFRKREEETINRVAMVTNGQLMGAFGSSISFVINLAGVASLIYLRPGQVSPGELFALLWIFGVFLARPFRQIPWIFTFSFDSLTSLRRLERFLDRPADPEDSVFGDQTAQIDELRSIPTITSDEHRSMQKPCAAAISIEVKGLNLSINGQNLLKEVSFAVAAGEFIAIVGEVGSGKSLLVLSLVAETGAQFERFRAGDVDLTPLEPNLRRRWFAFVPQEGFVMSASLRENVASHYEVDRSLDASIQRSLGLSQLSLETEQVRDGLDTEIGERGVNLSGGQKQRVSLARAHFFDRPVVLLDDCLSAVDVDTERRLVEELIDGAWAGRTRILVTHRLSVLERVDRVFFMEAGRIVEVGTFKELMMTSKRMNDFVASVQRSEAQRQNIESQEVSSKAEGVVSLSGESEFESTDLERMGDVEAESVS